MLSTAPRRRSRAAQPSAARRAAGFSLVELVVATAMMGTVIFFALGTFTFQHQTYVVVDQVSEAQQNMRSIAVLVERDIRNAGFMVSPEAAVCGVDRADDADTLFVSDPDAIRSVDQLPSHLRSRELGATATPTPTLSTVAMTVDNVVIDELPSYDTNGDTVADSDFRINAGAIVVDVANPDRGVGCGFVRAVTPPSSISVEFVAILSATAAVPADLRLVPAHVYEITDPGGGAPVELQRNGVLIAKDVEDLQLAWFYDDDDDGQVDGNEYRGVSGNDFDNELIDGNALREVRFNLVMRTRGEDPRNPDSASVGQSLENRTVNVPGADGRRRRVHISTVRVRNVAI